MGLNKKTFPKSAAAAAFDPLQNFETVTYTGNGSTQKITGYIRKGAAFNGSSSKIQLPQDYGAEGETFSYSFWFNTSTNAGSASDEYIISKRNGENTFHIRIHTDGTIAVNNWSGSGTLNTHEVRSTSSYTDGNWHHFVFTYDGNATTKTICYIDGSRDTSMDWTYDLISQSISNGNVIGQIDIGGRTYTGKLDQVRIFNKALSSGEVTTLYNETYASSTKSTTDIFGDGSGVALYELDEDANDTGGTYNGTPTNVNFLGMAFQPDLVWIKDRSGTDNHVLQDSIRGVNSVLFSNLTNAVSADTDNITSFNSNGFSIGTSTRINASGDNHVAWCWKAGGAAVSNTDGTITSQVSANQAAGFSIVKWTAGSDNNATIGHGLSQAPEIVIYKILNTTGSWHFNTTAIDGSYDRLQLNTTNAKTDVSSGQEFTSTTFKQWSYSSGNQLISYCFHSVDGYQKIGSYTGNGLPINSITTGFQPRFLLVKQSDASRNWNVYDNLRVQDRPLFPNLSNAEAGDAERLSFDSNGFTWTNSAADFNAPGGTYIYLAIA